MFEKDKVFETLPAKIDYLRKALAALAAHPAVKEIRQCGLIAGIELEKSMGEKAVLAAREQGLLTRNILDTLVFMPPLSITTVEIDSAMEAFAMQGYVTAFP